MSARRILGVAAGVQLLLAVVTWWPSGATTGAAPLLDVKRDAIARIELAQPPVGDEAVETVVLAREGEDWVVASAGGYPARSDKVEELLQNLTALRAGDVVGTRPESHNALGVGEDDWGRRISVTAADETTALVLGAATSKSVNVRLADGDDVFRSPGVSEWGFGATGPTYYEPVYVRVDPTAIGMLTVSNAHGTFTVQRRADALTLADATGDEEVDEDALDRFVGAVSTLRMTRPVGRGGEPDFGLEAGAEAARVDWTIAAEDQSIAGGYALGVAIDGDRYAKAVDSEFVVRVLDSATARLREAKRSDFVIVPEAPEES